jgi:hypothetical protein
MEYESDSRGWKPTQNAAPNLTASLARSPRSGLLQFQAWVS